MKNFRKINFPKFDLYKELNAMLADNTIHWSSNSQICINTTQDQTDDFTYGCGSLTKDWNNKIEKINEDGTIIQEVPLRDPILQESDFTKLVSVFNGTLFEEVYELLNSEFNIGRIRLMKMNPHHCMSWHDDSSPRLHYPIKSQMGCMMIIDDEVMHIPENEWWLTNTEKYHTALNSSNETRIHLVAAILESF